MVKKLIRKIQNWLWVLLAIPIWSMVLVIGTVYMACWLLTGHKFPPEEWGKE